MTLGHTLQPTASIQQVYVRPIERNTIDRQHRAPFLAVAAKMMSRTIALDEALTLPAKLDEPKSRMVELRYCGGLAAEVPDAVLGVSLRTVHCEGDLTRAWLNTNRRFVYVLSSFR